MSNCYPIVMPDNATYTESFGFLDSNGAEIDLTGVECKMDFKLTKGVASSSLFSLTNDDGLEVGTIPATITYTDEDGEEVTKTFTGKGVVRMTVSWARAALMSGKKGWTDLLMNFGSDRVDNAFPDGRPWVGCLGTTTPPPDDPVEEYAS